MEFLKFKYSLVKKYITSLVNYIINHASLITDRESQLNVKKWIENQKQVHREQTLPFFLKQYALYKNVRLN